MRLIAAGIFLTIACIPFSASADSCNSAFELASSMFNNASSAFDQEDYITAERLFNDAATMYESVSAMTGCRCPKIAGSARHNAGVSRTNAQISGKTLEVKQQPSGGLTNRQAALLCGGQSGQSSQEQQQYSAQAPLQYFQSDPAGYFQTLAGSSPDQDK